MKKRSLYEIEIFQKSANIPLQEFIGSLGLKEKYKQIVLLRLLPHQSVDLIPLYSLQEIADKTNYTRERIRQIIAQTWFRAKNNAPDHLSHFDERILRLKLPMRILSSLNANDIYDYDVCLVSVI